MATDYLSLIPSYNREQPKFSALVALLTGACADIQTTVLGMVEKFDVDTAVGDQLDIIGLWVGFGRKQKLPLPNVFFSWNTLGLGWNQANWRGPFEPDEGLVVLDDDTYRAFLKGRIGANYWNGTNEGLLSLASALSALGVQCYVRDNFDMTVDVYIVGDPSAAVLELIKRNITPPKAAGVRVAGYYLGSEPGSPYFVLGTPSGPEAGLDFGSFGTP